MMIVLGPSPETSPGRAISGIATFAAPLGRAACSAVLENPGASEKRLRARARRGGVPRIDGTPRCGAPWAPSPLDSTSEGAGLLAYAW